MRCNHTLGDKDFTPKYDKKQREQKTVKQRTFYFRLTF